MHRDNIETELPQARCLRSTGPCHGQVEIGVLLGSLRTSNEDVQLASARYKDSSDIILKSHEPTRKGNIQRRIVLAHSSRNLSEVVG